MPAPILAANRAHNSVHYPTVAAAVQQKTGKKVSLPTLRPYGKEELGAKQRKDKKRTADECKCRHGRESECACVLVVQRADKVAAALVPFSVC